MSKAKTIAKVDTSTPVTFKVTASTSNRLHTLAIDAGNALKSSADALVTLCGGINTVTRGVALDEATVQDLLAAMQKGCKWTGKNSIKAQRTKWKGVFESYTLLPEAIKALRRNAPFARLVGDVGSAHAFYMANKLNKPSANVRKIVLATAKFFAHSGRKAAKGPRVFDTHNAYQRQIAITCKALLAAKAPGSAKFKAALRKLCGEFDVNLGKA